MKSKFEPIFFAPNCSFRIEEHGGDKMFAPWHYHREMELKCVLAGRGRRCVGDSVEEFSAGDIVLIGRDLPHGWQETAAGPAKEPCRAIVVHLRDSFLGEAAGTPELGPIRAMLQQASHGISFSGEPARQARAALEAGKHLHGPAAVAQLLVVLDHLAGADARLLVGPFCVAGRNELSECRLQRVYSYLQERFREPLTLAEIAKAAAMSPAAFSRYFKNVTDRNVSEVLTELRISYAANCLLETDRKIGNIAFESGFETLSSFNRQFLRLKKMQPRRYRDLSVATELRSGPARGVRLAAGN